eukprot:2881420-Rhodomonas_salina.4
MIEQLEAVLDKEGEEKREKKKSGGEKKKGARDEKETDIAEGYLQCLLRSMVLRSCYSMWGTAMVLRTCYAISCTEIRYGATRCYRSVQSSARRVRTERAESMQ